MRHVLLVLVLGMVVVLTVWPVNNPDAWTHLALGEHLARERRIPHTDVLSFTVPADRPYVDHEWLYQLVLLGAFRLGGTAGITVTTAWVLVLTFGVIAAVTWRKGTGWLETAVLTVGVLTAYQRFHVRPEAFSFLMTCLLYTSPSPRDLSTSRMPSSA